MIPLDSYNLSYELRVRRCSEVVTVSCPYCKHIVEWGQYVLEVTILETVCHGRQPLSLRRRCPQCRRHFTGIFTYPTRQCAEDGLSIVQQCFFGEVSLRFIFTVDNPDPPPKRPVSPWP